MHQRAQHSHSIASPALTRAVPPASASKSISAVMKVFIASLWFKNEVDHAFEGIGSVRSILDRKEDHGMIDDHAACVPVSGSTIVDTGGQRPTIKWRHFFDVLGSLASS
jgi:hypothetical protein